MVNLFICINNFFKKIVNLFRNSKNDKDWKSKDWKSKDWK